MSSTIQETKELIEAIGEVSEFMVERLKDGVDLSDGMALVSKLTTDSEFQSKILKAAYGIQNIPDELKDLNEDEIAELASLGIKLVFSIIKAAKKKE